MPRRARIMAPGLPVHIVQRGNNRQPCFFEEQDRPYYLFHLRRLLPRFGVCLHAYCLMTNHVHLLVTPADEHGCARLMKHIGQLHTQYVNRNYRRSGTLWEGRFKSCLVQNEDYLLSCYRYIELNPVRAGICGHPREYPWSSYRANAESVDDVHLTPHEEFKRLGQDPMQRKETYATLFGTGLEGKRLEEIRAATNGNTALGDESFKQRLTASLGRRVYRGQPGRPARA
jgi:putative transposase